MTRKNIIKIGIVGVAISPLFAMAAALETLTDLVKDFGGIVQSLLPIVFALAILAFFYGIFLYVFSQSTDAKKEGKGVMIWSLVAIFVMASLFGIISLAQDTLGITDNTGDFDPTGVEGLGQ